MSWADVIVAKPAAQPDGCYHFRQGRSLRAACNSRLVLSTKRTRLAAAVALNSRCHRNGCSRRWLAYEGRGL